MPRIWADTIDTHRRQVSDAILAATADLIAEHGPMSVSMSAIAERAGIGRATLYKYFPDVEAILVAWHTRDFSQQLQQLQELAERDDVTLPDVAHFIRMQRRHHTQQQAEDLVGTLAHTIAGFDHAVEDLVHREVTAALTTLVARLAADGQVRRDLDPATMAFWIFHAAHAPADLDEVSLERLLLDSLAPPTGRRRSTTR